MKRLIIITVGLSLAVACARAPEREPEAPGSPAAPRAPTPVDHTEPAAPLAEAPAEAPAEPAPRPAPKPRVADQYAESVLTHLRRRVQQETELEDDVRKSLELKVGQLRRNRKLVVTAYTQRQYQPFTSAGDELTDDGKLAVELLMDVESHGLEPSPYPVQALSKAKARYDAARESLLAARAKVTPGSPLSKLVKITDAFEPRPGDSFADQRVRVANKLLGFDLHDELDAAAHIRELDGWWKELLASRKAIREVLGEIDALVVQGFFQYALDFRHLVVAHPFDAVPREEIPGAAWRHRRVLLSDLRAADGKLGEAMRSFWPKHPYYEKSRAALAKYSELHRTAAVPEFKLRGRLKKGMKGKKVVELKVRLNAEGFYDGDLADDKFGADLEEAVKRYQRHHQLDEDGIVQNKYGLAGLTRTSLEVPMERRVEALKLSLQRWRESPSHKEPFYFRVNVPQFEVEVWEGNELARKHRIVVGNNKFELDPDHGRKGHLNRTALISDEIERVVINPLWHVPERIKIQEVLVEAAEDPNYMEKHGYKTRILADGTEQIYQEAGPGNALGQVKLLFPNRHAIYMHDTPKKQLFGRTIRAYSHGCMRLEDPVDMATYLLERDGTMDADEVQRTLRTRKERGVTLKTKVPIHIEYNTVAFVPGDPEPIFLNDIYKYDRAYWKGQLPLEPHQKIPIVKTELPTAQETEEPDPRAEDGEEGEAPAPQKNDQTGQRPMGPPAPAPNQG